MHHITVSFAKLGGRRAAASLVLLLACWLGWARPAEAATNIPLNLINGNVHAPYAAVGETTATITAPGASMTFAVHVETGLMYGVQLYPGTIQSVAMTLDDASQTSGSLTGVDGFGGTKYWFDCSRDGTLLIDVASTTGTSVSPSQSVGDFAVRVLRTNAVAVSGNVNNTQGRAAAGLDIDCVPADGFYGDGGWLLDKTQIGTMRADGSYSVTLPAGWSGWVFAGNAHLRLPLVHTYVALRDDLPVQNFDFTTTTLSGVVKQSSGSGPLAGARITATQDSTSSYTLTMADGSWSLVVPKGWTGAVTASIATSVTQYSFSPDEIDITDANWPNSTQLHTIDFSATPLVRLSGTIKLDSDSVDAPVSGVSVHLTDGSVTQTRPDGSYRFYVAYGWSGYAYTAGRAGSFFCSPPAVPVPLATADTQLTPIVLKQYESLDTYYNVTLNNLTAALLNAGQIVFTSSTIVVHNTDPANDMLKITRKLSPTGKALDYPPIGNVVVTAAPLTAPAGAVAPDGGLKSFYTEGSVEYLGAMAGLGKVASMGCYISEIETSGTLGAITMSNSRGNRPAAFIIAHGAAPVAGQKSSISLQGVTLGGLYAPERIFSSVKTASKKVTPLANKPSIWLPGNVDAPGYWDTNLERDYQNGVVAEREVAIDAQSIGTLGVTEGYLYAESLAGSVPLITAKGSKNNDGSIFIGWMDNTDLGKVAITTVGGDVDLYGDCLVAGGVSAVTAKTLYWRSANKTDKTVYQNGGHLDINLLATGVGLTNLSLASGRAKANVTSLTGDMEVLAGAVESGAFYNRGMGIVQPGYFAVTNKVTTGLSGLVAGSFYSNGHGTANQHLPVFSPTLTTELASDVWIEDPDLTTFVP